MELRLFYYHKLIKEAKKQLTDIAEALVKLSEKEKSNNTEIEIEKTYFIVGTKSQNSLSFSLGLRSFFIKMSINLKHGNQNMLFQTFEVLENHEILGSNKAIHLPTLDILGNHEILSFKSQDKKDLLQREKIGSEYIRALINEIDNS